MGISPRCMLSAFAAFALFRVGSVEAGAFGIIYD